MFRCSYDSAAFYLQRNQATEQEDEVGKNTDSCLKDILKKNWLENCDR